MSFTNSIYRNSLFATVLVSCVLGLHCPDAQAQRADDRRTVTERFRTVLPANGVPVGAMRLYPQLGFGFSWSDNVFANNAFEESDWASNLLAEARLESNTSLYSVEVGGRAEVSRFDQFNSNDVENIRFWITRGTRTFRAATSLWTSTLPILPSHVPPSMLPVTPSN